MWKENMRRYIICIIIGLVCLTPKAHAGIGITQLEDSLYALTGFSPMWCSPVRVKSLRVNGDNIAVYTNATLNGVRWTKEELYRFNSHVSQWVLGNNKGKVTIYTNRQPVNELITDCSRGVLVNGKTKDLSNRNIALWPSHGLYYNTARDEWIWQRATLWTTVEDLYSQEYVRLLKQMLENAGATIFMPRAGLDQSDLGPSGMPRWTEGARYWIESQGADSAVWNLYDGDHYKDDMKSRCMWVNALSEPIDLCLALHTDGMDSGNDTATVGTLVIYTPYDDDNKRTLRDGRNRQTVNRNLADWVQTQVTEDLRRIAPEWTRRQLMEANYCESRVPVVPNLILELVSHKNMADMRYGLDPAFRFAATRAIYKGILRFLNGKAAVVQPLPVRQLRFDLDGTIRWQAELDSLEPTAKPTYYLVYMQRNDGEWEITQVDKLTETHVALERGVQYNCFVVAGNEGGLSMPSPVVSAYLSEREDAPTALVIDGFDDVYGPEWFADSLRAGIVPGSYACEDKFSCAYIGEQWNFDRASLWTNDDNCGWGACYRDHAGEFTIGNTHDYCVHHGHLLRRMRISYAGTTAGMLTTNPSPITDNPSPFTFIDYICGRNRVPIDSTMQTLLADYVAQGGRLLLSGDHWRNIDAAWLRTTLHTEFYADHATRSGRVSSPRHRLYTLVLQPNEDQLFTCTPEGLRPADTTAVRIAEYQDMRCAAAVGWQHHTLVYGFPLETVTEFDKILRHAIEWLFSE